MRDRLVVLRSEYILRFGEWPREIEANTDAAAYLERLESSLVLDVPLLHRPPVDISRSIHSAGMGVLGW